MKKLDKRPKTIFCDIDGTLIEHRPPEESAKKEYVPKLLPGTLEKLREWDTMGYNIILTTGRRESSRKVTEEQLSSLGIYYDYLIMGIGGGDRILINDKKPNCDKDTCFSFSNPRNQGISNINI